MKTDEPLDKFIKNGILEFDNIKASDKLKSRILRRIERERREDKLVAEYAKKIRVAKLRFRLFKTCATMAMLAFVITAVISVCLAKGRVLSGEESWNSQISDNGENSKSTKHFVIFNNKVFSNYSENIDFVISNSNNESSNGIIGFWDDNKNWFSPFSLNHLNADSQSYKAFQNSIVNFNNRIKVNVVTNDGEPVSGVNVNGYNNSDELVFSAVTDNQGVAYLFSNVLENNQKSLISYIKVSANGKSVTCRANGDEVTVMLDMSGVANTEKTLELMFSVSTKQSMEEEFDVICNSIGKIIENIRKEYPTIKIRMSVNFYRNVGEEYFVRSFPFYDDPNIAVEILKQQDCAGGGEYVDSFSGALVDAVYAHDWTDGAYAKLLFMIYDSPPRQTDSVTRTIIDATGVATAKGIRIIPITPCVTDSTTEFVSRSLATATGGTYAFFADSDINDYTEYTPLRNYRLYPFSEGTSIIIEKYIN